MKSTSLKQILISLSILIIFSVSMLGFASYMDKNFIFFQPIISKPKNLTASTLNPVAIIDTSPENEWVYFDFSSSKVVKIDDRSSLNWDLAFKKNRIISNSGKTNQLGKGGILNLGRIDINEIDKVPEKESIPDTLEDGMLVNKAIKEWYDYSVLRHTLTSNGDLYIVRTADEKYAKMKILGYYCGDKTGCYTIEYVYPIPS